MTALRLEQSGSIPSDNTARQQSDNTNTTPNFQPHQLLGEAAGLPVNGRSVDQHLPKVILFDSANQPGSNNPNEVHGTQVGHDNNGQTNSYSADGFSVAKHDDGKWYYHQDNKDGSKFVEVNNVQMDNATGKVSFHETGLFGKDGTIGGGEAPQEQPSSFLGQVQAGLDTTTHTVLGDTVANGIGNTLVDAAHGTNDAINQTAIAVDQIPTFFENKNWNLTEGGKTALNDIKNLNVNGADLWSGANIHLSDGGATYENWKRNLPGLEVATSSHQAAPGTEQYRVKMGAGDAYLLFGKGADGNTFFQMERHGFGGSMSVLGDCGHALDTVTYWITDSNVGPNGVSPRTDKRPLAA